MSSFRTILPIEKSSLSIDYQNNILCLGSCFTENIGQLLIQHKLPTLLNPFGILYNPISIKKNLEILLSDKIYREKDLFFQQDLWHSFDHHGAFSHTDLPTILENINTNLNSTRQFLQNTNRLILTFGTANVFIKKSTGNVVANCHKVPNNEFEKRRLMVSEIVRELTPILEKLKYLSPDLEIIFTVSPVRHIKEGLLENQRSKATLLLAIEKLTKQLNFAHYFPAYEAVLDDLRDYRFFEKDMVHPNEIAIQYVWEQFQKSYFSTDTISILNQVRKIVQASQHRPFYQETKEHQYFVKKQLEKIENLAQQFPFLKFKKEREIFQAQLNFSA